MPCLSVEELSGSGQTGGVRDITRLMLRAHGRVVTDAQFEEIISSALHEPTMLYLSLAVRAAVQWKSWSPLSETALQPTVHGIIEQNFNSIELSFGPLLTRAALGLITLSQNGLSDQELEDLLSLDDAVLDEVFQYSTPAFRRLPSHVWLRVKGALEGLLVEGEGGRMRWYHRQLKESATSRYSSSIEEKKHLHELLATYFGNTVDDVILSSRRISEHPLVLDLDTCSSNIWSLSNVSAINPRRCHEAAHHMVEAGLVELAVDELCSLDTVCAHFHVNAGFEIVSLLSRLMALIFEHYPEDEAGPTHRGVELKTLVEHYYRWLRKDASSISVADDIPSAIFNSLSQQPLSSVARRDLFDLAHRLRSSSHLSSLCYGSAITASPVLSTAGEGRISCYRSLVIGGKSEGEFDSLIGVLTGHSASICAIAWNSDGSRLASSAFDKQVNIWDTSSGNVVVNIQSHNHGVNSIAWSRDSSLLASGDDQRNINISHSITGASMRQLSGHKGKIRKLCWHPHDNLIASASDDGQVIIWSVENGKIMKRIKGFEKGATSVHWHPRGDLLAVTSQGGCMRVFVSPSSRADCSVLRGNIWAKVAEMQIEGSCSCAEFSSDGLHLASGGWDHLCRVYSVSSWQQEVCLSGHKSWLSCVCWSPNSHLLASASEDRSIVIWDVHTGMKTATLTGHMGTVLSCAWSPDGNVLASSSHDMTIRLWASSKWMPSLDLLPHDLLSDLNRVSSIVETEEENEESSLQIPVVGVKGVAYHPNALVRNLICSSGSVGSVGVDLTDEISTTRVAVFATASDDGCGRVWHAKTGCLVSVLHGHTHRMWSICIDRAGVRAATCSADSTARVWDLPSGTCIVTLEGHEKGIPTICWSPCDQMLVTGSWDCTARVWNANNGQCLHTLSGHTAFITGVAWSPHGDHLSTVSHDKTMRIWSSFTGQRVTSWQCGDPTCVDWSPSKDRVAVGFLNKTVQIWDFNTKKIVGTLSKAHKMGILCVSWNPSETLLASGSWDCTIVLWNVPSWKAGRILNGHQLCVRRLCWNEDGSTLMSSSEDGTIRFWNKHKHSKCFAGVPSTPRFFHVCRPLKLLAVPGNTGKDIRIWNVQRGNLTQVLRGHMGIVTSLKWSPAMDSCILSGDDEGAVVVWHPHPTRKDTWRVKHFLTEHDGPVLCVDWNDMATMFASCAADCTMRIWNEEDGKCLKVCTMNSPNIARGYRHMLQWSPDGALLAWCVSGVFVKVYDTENDAEYDLNSTPECVSWNPTWDKRHLIGLNDPDELHHIVWDLADTSSITTSRFLKKTSHVLSSTLGVVCLWWHCDGTYFAVAHDDGSVDVFDADTFKISCILKGHTGAVNHVSWSPDGRDIATASDDGTIRIWTGTQDLDEDDYLSNDVTSVELKGHVAAVRMVEWCNGSRRDYLTSIGLDGDIRVWDYEAPMEVRRSSVKLSMDTVTKINTTLNSMSIDNCD